MLNYFFNLVYNNIGLIVFVIISIATVVTMSFFILQRDAYNKQKKIAVDKQVELHRIREAAKGKSY